MTDGNEQNIIFLIRGPLVSVYLTVGKNVAMKNSALSYQDEGAIFYALN